LGAILAGKGARVQQGYRSREFGVF